MTGTLVNYGSRARYTMLQVVMDGIEPEARRLLASGILGRSPQLVELFEYLVQASTRDRSPKEAEIAQDVFGRDSAFEPGQDALVRVHVHRLRTKLERFYADQPSPALRLTIPKGEYRLVLEGSAPALLPELSRIGTDPRPWPWRTTAALLALACVALGGFLLIRPSTIPAGAVSPSLLWDGFRKDSRTALIIAGDRALPKGGEATGLPVGVATALRHVIPALVAGNSGSRRLRLLPMSQVTPDMMRAANIVYVGKLRDIAMIGEPLFAATRVVPDTDGRSLTDRKTGRLLVSAPLPGQADNSRGQTDFGYLASFRGPSNNRIVVIAGGGNAGLMQAAEVAGSDARMREIAAQAGGTGDFEAVLIVSSLHDMNMGSRLELAAPIDAAAIWREDKTN